MDHDETVATAIVQAAARRHQLRIAVQLAEGAAANPAEVADQLRATLTDVPARDLRVEPLFPEDPDGTEGHYLVVGNVEEEAGSVAYARKASEVSHLLQDTGSFARVEADIPVAAFEPPPEEVGAFGRDHGDNHLAGTEVRDWARRAINCAQAWALEPAPGGARKGAGVRIGHPDSGYSDHFALGLTALDLTTDRDVISNDDDALDPLVPPDQSPWPQPSPGHGTGTGSVIAGRGNEQAGVVGVAPEAMLVPVRAIESVVQLFDSDVARAVDHARLRGCQVISMSLGGKGFFGLRKAIQRAVDSGMIVMAAAGNHVGVVVEPASYDTCIAVGGTGIGDRLWEGSSRGTAVDISAPAECVHVAKFDWDATPPTPYVERSHGTSFSVAHLAGTAALWLARHGVQTVVQRYQGRVQAAFLHLLRTRGCRRPANWDDDWGVGVVDARALLEAELPERDDLDDVGAFGAADDPVQRLSALANTDPVETRDRLASWFQAEGAELDRLLRRYEGELAYLVAGDTAFRSALREGGPPADVPGAFGPPGQPPVPAAASQELSDRLAGP